MNTQHKITPTLNLALEYTRARTHARTSAFEAVARTPALKFTLNLSYQPQLLFVCE